MRPILRTLLFLSAFSPALISLAFVRYLEEGETLQTLQFLTIGILGSTLPLLIIHLVKAHGESYNIQVKKVESNDFMLLAFVGSYISPFILRGSNVSAGTIGYILLGIGCVLWLISALPAHPILRMIKFRFYKIELSNGIVYTLIAKRHIRDPKELRRVKQISETMLIEEL